MEPCTGQNTHSSRNSSPAGISPAGRLDMRILVTGGAGFIGSYFVRALLNDEGYAPFSGVAEVTVYDKLTYAGNLANLEPVAAHPRYQFVHGDICDAAMLAKTVPGHDLVNFAAESHVDRSVDRPRRVRSGPTAGHPVCFSRLPLRPGSRRVVQVSTDEVYGSIARWIVPGGRTAGAQLAVLGLQGRWRPDRARVCGDARPADGRSREAPTPTGRTSTPAGNSAVRHPPARRLSPSRCTATAATARLAARRRPLPGHRAGARGAGPVRSTTSAAASS